MAKKKTNQGGFRENAKRPLKYGEETKRIVLQVPISKEMLIKKRIKLIMDEYLVKESQMGIEESLSTVEETIYNFQIDSSIFISKNSLSIIDFLDDKPKSKKTVLSFLKNKLQNYSEIINPSSSFLLKERQSVYKIIHNQPRLRRAAQDLRTLEIYGSNFEDKSFDFLKRTLQLCIEIIESE